MRFEDRVAQYILAILYSHYHLDVSLHQIPDGTKQSKMKQETDTQIKESKARGNESLVRLSAGFDTMPANPDIGLAHHRLVDKERHETFKEKPPEKPYDVKYKGSEVYENTVACLLRGDTLYFAVNFKVRRNTDESTYNKFQEFVYSNFGEISESAMDDVRVALRQELTDPLLMPKYRFFKLGFIAPVVMPTDADASAAFHAEMQLVANFEYTDRQLMAGWYIGVSKPCCGSCTPELQGRKVEFAGSHELKVTNWKAPSTQQAMLKKICSIAT